MTTTQLHATARAVIAGWGHTAFLTPRCSPAINTMLPNATNRALLPVGPVRAEDYQILVASRSPTRSDPRSMPRKRTVHVGVYALPAMHRPLWEKFNAHCGS